MPCSSPCIPTYEMNPKLIQSKITASLLLSFLAVLGAIVSVNAGPSLGLQTDLVLGKNEAGSFPLMTGKQAAPIFLDQADWAGVLRAGADLQADVERVTGTKPALATNAAPAGKSVVIIGTL